MNKVLKYYSLLLSDIWISEWAAVLALLDIIFSKLK